MYRLFSFLLHRIKDISYLFIFIAGHSTVTYSSVVAGWNADQKGCWFKSNQFFTFTFYFKSEEYWFKSSEHSKSVNLVNTNKKILHLSSLLQYNYLTKYQSFIFFSKISKRATQAKTNCLCRSISIY